MRDADAWQLSALHDYAQVATHRLRNLGVSGPKPLLGQCVCFCDPRAAFEPTLATSCGLQIVSVKSVASLLPCCLCACRVSSHSSLPLRLPHAAFVPAMSHPTHALAHVTSTATCELSEKAPEVLPRVCDRKHPRSFRERECPRHKVSTATQHVNCDRKPHVDRDRKHPWSF